MYQILKIDCQKLVSLLRPILNQHKGKLEHFFRGKRMSPTSLNRPIVEKGCIYNLSFFVRVCVSMGAIFQNLSPSVTLKMGSRSPKSNQFLSLSQQQSCTFGQNPSIHSGDRMQKSHSCDLENQGLQNLISSFSCHNNIVVQVWSKSIHSFMR